MPSLTVPPTPQACLIFFASALNSDSESTRFLINVTPLPLRPLESRCRYTVCCFGGRDLRVGLFSVFLRKSPESEDQTVRDSFCDIFKSTPHQPSFRFGHCLCLALTSAPTIKPGLPPQ